jgi:hypothetical protein
MTVPNKLPHRIGRNPRVYVTDGFASDGEIAHVLARYGAAPKDLGIDWDRSIAGLSGELPIDTDRVLARLADRIEAVLGFGIALSDRTFRFRRYAIGDYHPAHVDCYAIAGHHLVATALVYLTDAIDGGETVFPQASPTPLTIGARRGRLALWFNYTPDGEVDRLSSHRSEALRLGEKATLAYFVYAPIACAALAPALAQAPEAACASF